MVHVAHVISTKLWKREFERGRAQSHIPVKFGIYGSVVVEVDSEFVMAMHHFPVST